MPVNKDTIANLVEKAMGLGAALQTRSAHAIAHSAVVDELYGVLDLLRSDASREAIQCSVEELIRQLSACSDERCDAMQRWTARKRTIGGR